jgi:catechol 2,3-dioxygenase-like lactoylglutathione lyase family enzyme
MDLQLDQVGVVVEDMGRSLAFYRELGLDLPPESDDQPHVAVTLPGGLHLAWDTADTIRSFDETWTPATGGARIGLAFRCGSPDAVDAHYRRLTDLGYEGHKAPWDAVWGQRYAVIHDPDGNSVELFAPNA